MEKELYGYHEYDNSMARIDKIRGEIIGTRVMDVEVEIDKTPIHAGETYEGNIELVRVTRFLVRIKSKQGKVKRVKISLSPMHNYARGYDIFKAEYELSPVIPIMKFLMGSTKVSIEDMANPMISRVMKSLEGKIKKACLGRLMECSEKILEQAHVESQKKWKAKIKKNLRTSFAEAKLFMNEEDIIFIWRTEIAKGVLVCLHHKIKMK